MTAPPQLSLLDDGHAAKLERDREHEVDRTPPLVCRQGLEWGLRMLDREPSTMLDIGAGAGVFGQQVRVLLHGMYRVAVEPREEEERYLLRHYEHHHRCDLATYLACQAFENHNPRSMWITSNPAFSIFPDIVRAFADELAAVLLYGSIAWGCSEEGAALFAEFPPVACARVVGRVNHRGPGINPATITKDFPGGKPWGADQRDVCWWLFIRGNKPKQWTTENLPPLPSSARRWLVPPGTEP